MSVKINSEDKDLEQKLRAKTVAAQYKKGNSLKNAIEEIQSLGALTDAQLLELLRIQQEQEEIKESSRRNSLANVEKVASAMIVSSELDSIFSLEKQQLLAERSSFLDDFLKDFPAPQQLKNNFKQAAQEFDVLKFNDKGQISEGFSAMERRNKLAKLRENGSNLKPQDESALAPSKKELDAEIKLHKDPKVVQVAGHKVKAGVDLQKSILGSLKFRELDPHNSEHQKKKGLINKMEDEIKDAGEILTKGIARSVGGFLKHIEGLMPEHKRTGQEKSVAELREEKFIALEKQRTEKESASLKEMHMLEKEITARDQLFKNINDRMVNQESRNTAFSNLEAKRKEIEARTLKEGHASEKFQDKIHAESKPDRGGHSK